MSNRALSAIALTKVAELTNIKDEDGRIQSALRFSGGLPLKVATVAFAGFEAVIRTALLIAALPMKLLAPKTFENMTEKTSSAIKTILNGTKALIQIHAKEILVTPAPAPATPKTWKETIVDGFNYGYNYCKDSRVVKAANEHRTLTAVVIGSAITGIFLYYNSAAILSYFQSSANGSAKIVDEAAKQGTQTTASTSVQAAANLQSHSSIQNSFDTQKPSQCPLKDAPAPSVATDLGGTTQDGVSSSKETTPAVRGISNKAIKDQRNQDLNLPKNPSWSFFF